MTPVMSDPIVLDLAAQLKKEGRVLPASAAMLCEAYIGQVRRMRDSRQRIDAEGEVVAGPRDQPIAHPSIATERAATAEVARLHKALLAGTHWA